MIIRVIDLETTGLAPPEHGVVEIAFCDLWWSGGPQGKWSVRGGFATLVDPGRPIPPEASAIHHITDEDVIGTLPWDLAAPPVLAQAFVEGQPIVAHAAHMAKFDAQWFPSGVTTPLIDTYRCALRLWPDAPSHGNQALRYWRKPEGIIRQEASIAHRAYPDAYVTAHLLRDMLALATIDQLIQWSNQPALQIRCHIGKWKGKLWSEVDPGFLSWLLGKEFDEDVKFTARHWLERHEQAAHS